MTIVALWKRAGGKVIAEQKIVKVFEALVGDHKEREKEERSRKEKERDLTKNHFVFETGCIDAA